MKIKKLLQSILTESKTSNSESVMNMILDKISKSGQHSLTNDERLYLQQYRKNKPDPELEKWLLSDDDATFDVDGDKLPFDDFAPDEDLFGNVSKLIRFINKATGKQPFSNSADWADALVWPVKAPTNYKGIFVYLNTEDESLLLINRVIGDGDATRDNVLYTATNVNELHKLVAEINKL